MLFLCSENNFRGGGTRRVIFRVNRGRDKHDKTNKDWGRSLRSHLEEDDVDMTFGANNYTKNLNKKYSKKKGNRPGSPVPNIKRKLPIANWYRITVRFIYYVATQFTQNCTFQIPYGNKYDKNFILQTLLTHVSPLPLIPICVSNQNNYISNVNYLIIFQWSITGTTVTFYVDDNKVADKLHFLDREIKYPNGFKMIIRVNIGSPNFNLTPDVKEKIKFVMGKRYNAAIKALDLCRFHTDPDFVDIFCALSKPPIFLAVMDIIAKNIPQIEALDISYNHIQIFTFLKNIKEELKNLKVLRMGNNKVPI